MRTPHTGAAERGAFCACLEPATAKGADAWTCEAQRQQLLGYRASAPGISIPHNSSRCVARRPPMCLE